MSRKAPAVQTPVETNVSFWIHGSKKDLIITNHDDRNWRHKISFEAVRKIRLAMDKISREGITETVTEQTLFGTISVTAHGNLFKVVAQPAEKEVRKLEATLSETVMDSMLASIRDVHSAEPVQQTAEEVAPGTFALV